MKFLHISDLHKLNDYRNKGGIYTNILNGMEDPFIQLNNLLKESTFDLDFVILSGDICEHGEIEDYLSVKDTLNQMFECPVLLCSGNHDNKNNLIQAFNKNLTEGQLFETYYFNDIKVILFDSSHQDYNDGFISDKTCDLLEQELNKEDYGQAILVTHHHLIKNQFTMPAARYPERFLKILDNSRILAILTGHTHHIYHGMLSGRSYHTTGGLSFVADQIDDKLCFYEKPSAILFDYENDEFKWKDLYCQNEEKILENWSL